MPDYKLIYWNVRAKAEPIRWMFAYGNIPFEDYRINEFPSYYSSAPNPEWTALKEQLPFGVIPVLSVDGKYLGESHAIARYLAKTCGLSGSNPWETAQADSILTYIGSEFDPAFINFMHETDPEMKKIAQEKAVEKTKKVAETLQKILQHNETGKQNKFFVGLGPTFVDFFAVSFGEMVEVFIQPGLMESYKLLSIHKEIIRGLPGVKEFIHDHAHLAM